MQNKIMQQKTVKTKNNNNFEDDLKFFEKGRRPQFF